MVRSEKKGPVARRWRLYSRRRPPLGSRWLRLGSRRFTFPRRSHLSPDGGGFTRAAVHRLAADGYRLAADGYDGQISEPDEDPRAEGRASRGSWFPDLAMRESCEFHSTDLGDCFILSVFTSTL
jgi:hypothetical protein